MWKTASLLLLTIVLIPVIAFNIDEPLSIHQKAILIDLILVYSIVAFACFLLSILTDNYSQVDKLWSIMPIVYAWIIAIRVDFEPRILLMAVLVTIWGVRLTYNFSRRGGYSIRFWSGDEDYRWSILREKPEFEAKWKWTLFNLLFISFYQMGLILLITLPALKSIHGAPMNWLDIIVSLLFIGFVITETIADQQQWNFQRKRQSYLDKGEDMPEKYKKGFVAEGLWAISRHPNYTSEQAIWIVFYFFSVSATGLWLNWSVTGCLLLVLLFRESSNLSESISAVKYPKYLDYQENVARFIPVKISKKNLENPSNAGI